MERPSDEGDLIQSIFFAGHRKRANDIRRNNTRFVHYTTAEVAASIITRRFVWMRNLQTMNDHMEFEHGFRCLKSAYNDEKSGGFLKTTLESLFPGFREELERRFDWWSPLLRSNTYLTCISEHRRSENNYGRLSMWRAYGGGNGVAVVMNNRPFLTESEALNAYTSPVSYLDDKRFRSEFDHLAKNIKKNMGFIHSLGKESVLNLVFHAFRFFALCTKHPGFHEEKEWRIIYSPDLEPSNRIAEDIHSVRGVPQKIYKIPLEDVPDEGLVGVRIPDLIERIIIGPTQYPQAMFQAFEKLLKDAGVENPGERIFVSDIPLRQ